MADEPQLQPVGLAVIGRFKGVKASEPFTRRDNGDKGMTNPKLGLEDADGNTFAVQCSQATLDAYDKRPRGAVIVVPVIARPPFGSTGPVKLVVRGDEGDAGGTWD